MAFDVWCIMYNDLCLMMVTVMVTLMLMMMMMMMTYAAQCMVHDSRCENVRSEMRGVSCILHFAWHGYAKFMYDIGFILLTLNLSLCNLFKLID